MRTPSIRHLLATCLFSAIIPAAASAQSPCESYSTKAGDTLGSIALAAYGTYGYQQIFNANRNVIGVNPNELEEGTVLILPCEDGSLPGQEIGAIIQEQTEAAASRRTTTNVYQPPIKLVTGGGWEPYSSERLSGGGFMVQLATTALQRGGNNREFNMSFVNDWGSHIDVLLPLGAFDISIAWFLPDCTKMELLSEAMRARCTDWHFTQPVYEDVLGYFSTPDNEYSNAREYSDFAGARICRPEGWSTYDLEEEGLIPPVIEMIQPSTIAECMQKLVDGDADIAPIELELAVATMNDLGIEGQVAENPFLTTVQNLHFVTHKTNPRGRVYIAMLNRGIAEMRETGEWYDIIASTLAEFNQMMLEN